MKKVLFIIKNENEASSRFRVLAYINKLKDNFHVDIFYAEYHNKSIPKIFRSLIKRIKYLKLLYQAGTYAAIYMQRPMSSDGKKNIFFEKLLAKINPNIIFDFDDALFVYNEKKITRLSSLAKICVCGNKYLYDFAIQHNNASYVIPTSIDTEKFIPALKNNKNITIGWTGTSGNYQFFTDKLINEINITLKKYPHVKFLFICEKKPGKRFNFPYDFIHWDDKSEVSDLTKIDVGLMPLIDSPWSRGKCGFKLIQYGAIGIPSIASDVGVNGDIIINKETGFLSINDDWLTPLEELINNATLRKKMGGNARKRVQENYSISKNYAKMYHLLSLAIDK